MPKNGMCPEKLEEIETHIAQQLTARDAVIDIEVLILGQNRRGNISDTEKDELLHALDIVRIGLFRGIDYSRRVRGKAEDYYL